jgi:hypothetical protein
LAIQLHFAPASEQMHMPLVKVESSGSLGSYGLVKLALTATLMAMLQRMQSVMRSLLQLVPAILAVTLEHRGLSMQVHRESNFYKRL